MEFIFSNSNRQKKSYRDKNSKLVDKKIQHAAQSDSEFYNATSVASAPVANLRRDKSKRAAQARCNAAVEMTRNTAINIVRKDSSKTDEHCLFSDTIFFDRKNGLERLSSLESSTGSINGNPYYSVNRNSMSSTHDSGLCSSSDISTAGHSGHFSDIEYEKSLGRKSKSQIVTKSTSALKFPSSNFGSDSELGRPSSVSSMPICRPRNSSNSPTLRTDVRAVIPRSSRPKLRPSSRSAAAGVTSSGLKPSARMVRHQSSTLPGWDIIQAPPTATDPKTDQRIEEMIETEREYVKSLNYIIKHYLPEMERNDIPATLRGHRSALFGNLERIRDFHQDLLLPDLERSKLRSSKIASIFLKYEHYLEMYALYVKNKPVSDRLLAENGKFFQTKQAELGDKMDLASYLLKPVQRLGKYSLFLDGISRTNGPKSELIKARTIIQFQLQHGDNLLAMDSIRGCEIDLKEQGKLLRQNEFNVMSGRKKAVRRIFLFENLILFTKPKRTTQGGDVYQYKNSWLTSEVGLTANIDDPCRFEIWLRRRNREKLIMQATEPNVKIDWVNEFNSLLLSQADKYREQRLKEMANMGVGNKPLMDIGGSNTITDRSVSVPDNTPRLRNSVALSTFDHTSMSSRTSQSIPRNVSLFSGTSGSSGISSMNASSITSPIEGSRGFGRSSCPIVKPRPNSVISNSPSSTCSTTSIENTSKTKHNCTALTSIFNKPDDVFDDDESDVDHPQPAYRQYETTV